MSSPGDCSTPDQNVTTRNKSVTSLSSSETHTATSSHGLDEKLKDTHQHQTSPLNPSPTEQPPTNPPVEPPTEKASPPQPAYSSEAEENYKPKTLGFWLIIMSTFVSMFLVALDRTIISTAIPAITNEFGSLGDIGWYGSAYMLTTAAFQLVFGRLYRFYDLRWTFIVTILIFEIGSAICGAAPNSTAFILGRAIAGLGSAGIFTGASMSIIPMVPLHKRPMFQCRSSLANRVCYRITDSISHVRNGLWHLLHLRPPHRRRLHRPRHVALVLLHEPPHRRRGRGLPVPLPAVPRAHSRICPPPEAPHPPRPLGYPLLHPRHGVLHPRAAVGGQRVRLERLAHRRAVCVFRPVCCCFRGGAGLVARDSDDSRQGDQAADHVCGLLCHVLHGRGHDGDCLLHSAVV